MVSLTFNLIEFPEFNIFTLLQLWYNVYSKASNMELKFPLKIEEVKSNSKLHYRIIG